jgi:Mn2+/Fe2+ NRAMP family transporter
MIEVESVAITTTIPARQRASVRPWLWVIGPGLVVMLADTEAGSVITAAQSGAQWGYRLLALQLVLIPILFIAQELTVRLGIGTGRGHGELIRERFGAGWAWLSVSTLTVACVGALITELGGLAGVGLLFGIPTFVTVPAVVLFLLGIVFTGSYRSVERVALAIGAFEVAFVVVAWQSHPDVGSLAHGAVSLPISNSNYLYLAAANVGAVVMPWMIFYQQSAVVDKGLRPQDLRAARLDTALGAVITQVIMCAILIAAAATIGIVGTHGSLSTVQDISATMTPFLGPVAGRLLFALGVSGAALLGAIVVSLTAAWGLGEVAGFRRSLEHRPREAPWFYGVYSVALLVGAGVILLGTNVVRVSVAVEVMNALLLPIVLGFLFLLALKALPAPFRIGRVHAVVAGLLLTATSVFGVYAAISGILQR